MAVRNALARRSKAPIAVRQSIEEAAMPFLARFEGHFEAEPAIGVYRLCRRMHRGNRHCAAEVRVPVGVAQMLVWFRPLRRDPAPAHNLARLHFENVGEVAAKRYLQLELYRLHTIIGDVEVFVHAAADRTADGKSKRARRDRAVFRTHRPIGEEDAACVVADGAATQQLPGFAIGIDPPTADDARVEEVETLFARPADLPVLLADQHRLALVDGDLRWADLDLERHNLFLH